MSRAAEKSNRAPDASGPPLRAFAMVLISLAILFAGLGFASFGGSDDEAATAASTTESETTAPANAAPAQPVATVGSAAPQSSTDPRSSAAQSSGTQSSAAPASAPTSAAAIPTARSSAPVAAAPRAGVRVFNNSNVAGLAAQTAELLEDEGFTITDTGNYSEGLLTATAVYYGTTAGEKETALAVADALGVTAQPRFAGIADTAPGVIVIVVQQ